MGSESDSCKYTEMEFIKANSGWQKTNGGKMEVEKSNLSEMKQHAPDLQGIPDMRRPNDMHNWTPSGVWET
jgi:hypothetical protein